MKTKNETTKESIASQVRKLASEGKNKATIVQIMTERLGRPIRYQHVFNILEQARLRELDLASKNEEHEEE